MSFLKRVGWLGALAVFGAGCNVLPTLTAPQIADPIGKGSEATPIAQLKGFGDIPAVPTPLVRPGSRGTIRITADVPDVPPNETVLRLTSARPNQTELQNIASGMNMPASLIGPTPTSHELTMEWQDDQNITWTITGSNRRATFIRTTSPVQTLTVSKLPEPTVAIQAAQQFLTDHGIELTRFGSVYMDPDWTEWWAAQKAQSRCMTAQTLSILRGTVASAPLDATFPVLPSESGSVCVAPELPAQMVIRFNAKQDGQAVFQNDSAPVYGASLVYDVATKQISSGWMTLGIDPDRSDYPGISLDEAKDRLSRGGQSGPPNGDATITAITFEWELIGDGHVPLTDYLYPALVGEGTIVAPDGTTKPYRVVVPLVKN